MLSTFVKYVKNLVFPYLKIDSTSPKIPQGHENDKFLSVIRADISYWRYVRFWLFVYSAGLLIGIIVLGFVGMVGFSPLFAIIIIPLKVIAIIKVIIMFIVSRISYELHWYIITDTSITVRQGAWTTREITVSYQNIQNVSVSQGPLERYFGFANLQIETAGSAGAGGHGKGGNPNQAVLRGVINAQQIRDIILENLRAFRNSGLGDPDDIETNITTEINTNRIVVLGEIAQEAALLRESVG